LPAPVFLNHFYLTLDSATFQGVRESRFLQDEFAPFEQRTTHRNDSIYTGIYFYGRNTYFEFFEEGKSEGKAPGASGIAFGIETPGGAASLSAMFPVQRLYTRRTETGEPPWFHSAERPNVSRADFFRTWVMEYHADFLAQWYPELSAAPVTAPRRRRNVLDRYVQKIGLGPRRGEFLMKDVTSIELSLPEGEARSFLSLLESLGYQVAGSRATGPEIQLTVTGAARPRGITAVEFSLQKSILSEARIGLGPRSELALNPRGFARWRWDG